jgi:pimeloyl-ACP methyl ester carboxylesterase
MSVLGLIAVVPSAVAEEGHFDSAGVKIHYTVQGEGEPVVLIHGFSVSGALWAMSGMVGKLTADYRVITIDCRGHGKSGKPHDAGKYGMEMVEDVVRLLDHLKIKRSHVVGYSMGGMITLKLLSKYPDRVISAVPAGSGWAPRDPTKEICDKMAATLESGKGVGSVLAEEAPEGSSITPEQIAAMDQRMLAMNDAKALAAALRGFVRLCLTEGELRRNKVPTLSIIGEKDSVKADVDRMIGVMANHRVEVIKGADHMEAAMRPEFLQHIKAFLAEHSKAKKAGE